MFGGLITFTISCKILHDNLWHIFCITTLLCFTTFGLSINVTVVYVCVCVCVCVVVSFQFVVFLSETNVLYITC